MIRIDAAPAGEGAGREALRAATPAAADGDDGAPPTITIERVDDGVKILFERVDDSFAIALDFAVARDFGAAIAAAAGSAFHRTRK